MTMAAARGADAETVAELLPMVEPHILAAWRKEDDDADD